MVGQRYFGKEDKHMLEIKNLQKGYNNRPFIHGINICIHRGEIHGLIGANGAGKTTLLKCATGIYKPAQGMVQYDEQDIYDNPEVKAKVAQAIKLLVQENQNRAEVLRIFPVKSRNLLTCHYLSGLPVIGIPLLLQTVIIRLDILYVEKNTSFVFTNKEQLWIYAGKAVIIFMLHYSLLIVCIKVANHVPGTVFTFAVMEFAMTALAGYCLDMYWNNLAEDSISNWVFWIIATVALILLSYIADQKRDYARNGFYAFSIVHWAVMGTVFGEIYFIFYGACGDIPKAVSVLVALAASVLITSGLYFVSKPEKT